MVGERGRGREEKESGGKEGQGGEEKEGRGKEGQGREVLSLGRVFLLCVVTYYGIFGIDEIV